MTERIKLSDFFKEGDTEIWYWKDPIWTRWDYDFEEGMEKIEARISEIKATTSKLPKEERIRLYRELKYNLTLLNFFKPLLTYDDFEKTHVKLGEIHLKNTDRIYWELQGENWSSGKNQAKAQELVSSLKTHTSMSIGDIIVFPKENKLFIVKSVGFEAYEFASKKRIQTEETLVLKSGTYALQIREAEKQKKIVRNFMRIRIHDPNPKLWYSIQKKSDGYYYIVNEKEKKSIKFVILDVGDIEESGIQGLAFVRGVPKKYAKRINVAVFPRNWSSQAILIEYAILKVKHSDLLKKQIKAVYRRYGKDIITFLEREYDKPIKHIEIIPKERDFQLNINFK